MTLRSFHLAKDVGPTPNPTVEQLYERGMRRPTRWGPRKDRAPELSPRNSLSIAVAVSAYCSRSGCWYRSALSPRAD